jgi:hypothetical protein
MASGISDDRWSAFADVEAGLVLGQQCDGLLTVTAPRSGTAAFCIGELTLPTHCRRSRCQGFNGRKPSSPVTQAGLSQTTVRPELSLAEMLLLRFRQTSLPRIGRRRDAWPGRVRDARGPCVQGEPAETGLISGTRCVVHEKAGRRRRRQNGKDSSSRKAERAAKIAVGAFHLEEVAIGPIIDAVQRDCVYGLVTQSTGQVRRFSPVAATARCSAGPPCWWTARWTSWHIGMRCSVPLVSIPSFSDYEETIRLAADSEYGLALGTCGLRSLKCHRSVCHRLILAPLKRSKAACPNQLANQPPRLAE